MQSGELSCSDGEEKEGEGKTDASYKRKKRGGQHSLWFRYLLPPPSGRGRGKRGKGEWFLDGRLQKRREGKRWSAGDLLL